MIKIYDAIIIGGGPGGYVAAVELVQNNKKVALIEKNKLGGVCTNLGCIPTKTMIGSCNALEKIRVAKLYGINEETYSIDFKAIMDRKDKIVESSAQDIEKLLKNYGIDIFKGTGKITSKDTVEVNEKSLQADNIIIAKGSRASKLPGLEFDGNRILNSDQAINLTELPKSLLIIGGGVIGVEFATIFSKLGTKVTIVEVHDNILAWEDPEISRVLEMIFRKNGVKVLKNHKQIKVNGSGVIVENMNTNEQFEIKSDKVLVAVGRTGNIDAEELDNLGIEHDGKKIMVNDYMETNIRRIYAIGDITAKLNLAHVAMRQAHVAAQNILGTEKKMDYSLVPNCIFTIPEISSVGFKDYQVEGSTVGKFPFAANGKAKADGETDGFIKVVSKDNKLIGAHIIGPRATDLIGEAALAIKNELSLDNIKSVIHAHPSIPEAFYQAVLDVKGEAYDLMKK